LQKAAYKSNKIITEHSFNISTQKTNLVAFKRRDPVTSETVIDNKITEQANLFHCLGNLISYEKEVDTDNRLNYHLPIAGLINNTFRPENTLKKQEYKAQQHTGPSFSVRGTEN
jgi:hypothetical protein